MAEYYFSLPTLPALTVSQQAALDESNQVAISGGPNGKIRRFFMETYKKLPK